MAQILVVEDSASLNRMMTLALETEGYSVASALGCDEAFDRVTTDTELLLLDLNLPGMDGMTCLTGVLERGFHGKVVLVSGSVDGRRLAETAGADGFLAKPFAPEELVATVEKHLPSPPTQMSAG
jgi:DNA-binding response OmpR family regulator